MAVAHKLLYARQDLKGAAMFLFEPIFIPFGERQKPRARPAGILSQQNDRKANPVLPTI
ncbi:hypothetical protein [Candidatus Avelusimicrobium sp.]